MSDFDIKNNNKSITSNNYLSNCYRHLTRSKIIHFFFLLIEMLLNIIQELDILYNDFIPINEVQNNSRLGFILYIIIKINKLKEIAKLLIMIIFVIIFDLLYLFFKRKNFLIKHTYISIILNILELIYFRLFILIFFNLLFTLTKFYFLIGLFLFMPHIYVIIENYLYNHLYYFVPEFIEYPFDEFSSLFDIILFFCKMILSIAGTSGNDYLCKFYFIVLFITQIIFCFYFIGKLINQSHLFMKNTFLNKTRICFFLTQTIIISFALLVGKNEILTVLFIIVSIGLLLIIMGYVYFMYNPFSYIRIKRERPLENIYFYLYILSHKSTLDFLFENKLNEHYEECGICDLCKKYNYFYSQQEKSVDFENEEYKQLLNSDKTYIIYDLENNNDNQLIDLFYIIYDGESKYFKLIKKMVINYKQKGKESFNNNAHYYVNLSFLIYSDYENNNITLSLNEKLILEMINHENRVFLDTHQSQIIQLLLCNQFIDLSNKVIKKLRSILTSEQNLNKAKKLIDLSFMLKEMKNQKYKKNLFSHKLENISNSKNLISACSIVYEEIFNTTINFSQIPIRDNIQPLEDTFRNTNNKNEKIITLSFNLNDKSCQIIRAGKGLSSYLNNNLFDLFPLIFQQYQINLFISNILANFDNTLNKEEKSQNITNNAVAVNKKGKKRNNKTNLKNIKQIRPITVNNKNKKEYVEIKLVLCENISSKIYYKLLTLKITPLFNNDNSCFILFDGLFYIHRLTVISIIDYEKNKEAEEKVFAVSDPELEKNNETYSMSLKKYTIWQNNQGYNTSKVSSFNISFKLYNIYMLIPRDKDLKKQLKRHLTIIKEAKLLEDDEEIEQHNSFHKNTRIEKFNLMEDNSSVTSQQTSSSHEKGLSGLAMRNKKKDNYYEYGIFNKLQKTIYITIVIILIVIIVEYINLNSLAKSTKNNSNSFVEYRDFYKLYFQLFALTLSSACIQMDNLKCRNIISFFLDDYFNRVPEESYDYNSFLNMQSELLALKMMERRIIMNKIHSNIGNKNYNEIFGKYINYSRVSQTFTKDDIKYNVIQVETQFSEAILIMCNSFKVITEPNDTKSIIYFLNKTNEPFSYLNKINEDSENSTDKELLSYQKEIYEMILNYKVYSREFDIINTNLKIIISKKSNVIKIFIYFFLNIDTIMILFIAALIYIYVCYFENIIIKILNYINMTINTKIDEKTSFVEMFNKKLANLEIIIQLFNGDPLKALQNLNTLYNEYQQKLTAKNKTEALEMAKRGYRKNSEEDNKKNDKYNIPKNQRIINRKEIRKLNIVSKYLIIFYIILLVTIILYSYLLTLWLNYFETKDNLYTLIENNCFLETSIYRAINIYNMMIFNNFTLREVSENIYPVIYNKEESISIIKSFYENLIFAFNNKKEKDILGKEIYIDFEDLSNFTCDNLFELNNDLVEELYKSKINNKPKNIKDNLIIMCNSSRIAESNDSRAAFERHFQYIKNGLIVIEDFTYDGLMKHLKEGLLGKISYFFINIIIYLLEILYSKPHQNAIVQIIDLLNKNILITEIIFIVVDAIFIIIILFFFISKIKNYCNQILLLKSTFKIFEIQEQ